MIKTLTITLIFFSIVLSCGKKGDPIYKESKETIIKQSGQKNDV